MQEAKLRARTSNAGEPVGAEQLTDFTGTVEDAVTDQEAAVAVDTTPVLEPSEDLSGRLDALEQQLRQSVAGLQQLLARQAVAADSELDVLRSSNNYESKVLRRSLVDDARTFLVATAGPRLEVEGKLELWHNYAERIREELGDDWFKAKKFPITCLLLLYKGSETDFQQGLSDTARKLRTLDPDTFRATYLRGRCEGRRVIWEKLYNFIATQE